MAADDDSAQKLLLIDAIQRLGVAYHFESEIDEVLKHMFDGSVVSAEEDVYTASLRFRLLRQQGYHVSCGESFHSYLHFSQYCATQKIFRIMKCESFAHY